MRSAIASLFVLAAVTAVLFVGDGRDVVGETPTPEPGSINVRFLRDGQPTTIHYIGHVPLAYANGVHCSFGMFAADLGDVVSDHFSWQWPIEDWYTGTCGKQPPTEIRLVFSVWDSNENRFYYLTSEFTWTGGEVWADVDVESAVPYPSPSPSATPQPTIYPPSTITMRFVRYGQLVVFPTLLDVPRRVFADGQDCNLPVGNFGVRNPLVWEWPLFPPPYVPTACAKGPPTTITFEFLPGFSFDVLWTGSNVEVDVEVPLNIPTVAPASMTPTPVPSPVAVPAFGGSPGGAGSVWPWAVVLAACAFGGALVAVRLRRVIP